MPAMPCCFSFFRCRFPDDLDERGTFQISLQRRAGQALGIMAAYCPDYDGLVIEGLTEESDTAIAQWNQEHPEAELLAGLAIMEVNSRRKGEEIMAELRPGRAETLEMRVTQNLTPVQWTILREAKRKKRCLKRAEEVERLLEPLVVGGDRDAPDECCSICLDKLHGSVIVRLPCGHHFHKICTAKWFASGKRKLLPSKIFGARWSSDTNIYSNNWTMWDATPRRCEVGVC